MNRFDEQRLTEGLARQQQAIYQLRFVTKWLLLAHLDILTILSKLPDADGPAILARREKLLAKFRAALGDDVVDDALRE